MSHSESRIFELESQYGVLKAFIDWRKARPGGNSSSWLLKLAWLYLFDLDIACGFSRATIFPQGWPGDV